MEIALHDGGTYLTADRFTSMDILLTTCLDWAIVIAWASTNNGHPIATAFTSGPPIRKESIQPAAGADRASVREDLSFRKAG